MEISFEFPLMMSYVVSYMIERFNVASIWVGRIFIVIFLICTISRLAYGGNAIDSLAGRLVALGVECFRRKARIEFVLPKMASLSGQPFSGSCKDRSTTSSMKKRRLKPQLRSVDGT